MNALAIDETINTSQYNIPSGIDILDLNNADNVLEWILKNAKELP
jgi:molybdopterin-guanine dinucleotide biosynthesis protein B